MTGKQNARKAEDEEAGGSLIQKSSSLISTTIQKISVKRVFVIYPDNNYILYWDALMLSLIFLYAFTIPYQLGVSGGSHLLKSVTWFVISVCMNSCFFIDTFLYFFRAYRDTGGRMVIEPKTIRRNYLKSLFIPNLLSNFPTTIIFYYVGHRIILDEQDNFRDFAEDNSSRLVLFKLLDILKLLRLGRVNRLLSTSNFVREFRENHKAYTVQLWVFCFLIIMAAHWFACIWSFVAYMEAGGFGSADLLNSNNWIGHWYKDNYEEGGLNPLGWGRDLDRYVMALFWAIQTITSIGYGNISPFTALEWWIGSILQLCAGILWAYIIGGLVGVVTALEVKNELFRERIDEANHLISVFLPPESRGFGRNRKLRQNDPYYEEKLEVAARIRRYIYTQNERPRSNSRYASSLAQGFPVMETLSPELQLTASLMFLRDCLERVPYLSSRFLDSYEQSLVAQQCVLLEFPCGEIFHMNKGVNEYGRGMLVQRSGLATRSSNLPIFMPFLSGGVFGEGQVLLQDGDPGLQSDNPIYFVSFSLVIFIPREAIMGALSRNPTAWACARWKYAGACLVGAAILRQEEQEIEIGDGTESCIIANHGGKA